MKGNYFLITRLLLMAFSLLLLPSLTLAATSVSKSGTMCGGSLTLTCSVSGANLTCSHSSNFGSCWTAQPSHTIASSDGNTYSDVYFRTSQWETAPPQNNGRQGVCAAVQRFFPDNAIVRRDCFEVAVGDVAISYSGTDDDNDRVGSLRDNCPSQSNINQLNTDYDAQGDACDSDDDGDGVDDVSDNCPLAYQQGADQLNSDGDGLGNICDADDDNDGVVDTSDGCRLDSTASSGTDSDGDGICNTADTDDDNDGVDDGGDAFPLQGEAATDTDGDGMPDTLGSITEGFETGNLWGFSPAFPWSIGRPAWNFSPHSGAYFAQSGEPRWEGETTWMKTTRITGAQISYWSAVDLFTKLRFYVDGVLQATTTSYREWVYTTVAVTPGQHELKWQIVNDAIGNGEYLQAFLDDINFGSSLIEDTDDDNDGVVDTNDAFPLNASESIDTDNDGTGNNADADDDNDGAEDGWDADPLDASVLCASGQWWNGSVCTVASVCSSSQYQVAAATQTTDTQCAALTPVVHCAVYSSNSDACLSCDSSYGLSKNGSCILQSADTDRDTLPDLWEEVNDRDPLKADYLVSAGGSHSCALDNTGIRCWGNNRFGQTAVPVLTAPSAVSAGYRHTCAIDSTGVKCWGAGTTNTGKNGSWGQAMPPVLTNPTAISAGFWHSCAIDAAGVHCWGKNDKGQIEVPALHNPIMVSAGRGYTCALDKDGSGVTSVVCWGKYINGRLAVPPLVNPQSVSVTNRHACAVDQTGLVCWGGRAKSDQPMLHQKSSSSQMPATGKLHSCLLSDSDLTCWGNNKFAQTAVPFLNRPVAVDGGEYHTCVLDHSGVQCWGRNNMGQTIVPVLDITHP